MPNHQTTLHQITQILLRPEDHYDELTQAIAELRQLFLDITGFDIESSDHREDIHLPGGKAIGPVWAALCVQEFMRTKHFLRGVYLGIKAALARFPEHPLHILYAGTGPFATLVTPLTTIFTPEEVQFTFLEVNPESIRYLNRVINALQAERFVKQIIQCDATQYQINPKDPIQIVITETMQNALQKEPQVAITLNLAPQLLPGGILIPQNIKIDAVLVSPKKDRERMVGNCSVTDCYRKLKTIFELNKDSRSPFSTPDGLVQETWSFPEVEVEIPPDLCPEYPQLALFTTIQVFDEEQLGPWECSLTLPKMLMRLDSERNLVTKVGFQYRMNETPGFEVQVRRL